MKMYDDFVRMYNDYSISVRDIKKEIGGNRYMRYRREAMRKGDIKQRPSNLRFGENYKYYHFDKHMQMFRVRRVINGKYISYGFYENEDEARDVVDKLKSVGWDKSKLV